MHLRRPRGLTKVPFSYRKNEGLRQVRVFGVRDFIFVRKY